LDSVLQKKLKELKKGEIVGNPEIEELKVKGIKYVIPIHPTNKNLGIIVGIIAKDENVSELSYRTNWDGVLESIYAYKKREPFLYVYAAGERIYVSCYKKEASKIVDKIGKEFELSNLIKESRNYLTIFTFAGVIIK
jgi:hypothetical protein